MCSVDDGAKTDGGDAPPIITVAMLQAQDEFEALLRGGCSAAQECQHEVERVAPACGKTL